MQVSHQSALLKSESSDHWVFQGKFCVRFLHRQGLLENSDWISLYAIVIGCTLNVGPGENKIRSIMRNADGGG